MTEYDYSPEAEARFWRKMDSVKQWRTHTGHYSLANPFEPRTPAASQMGLPDIPRPRTMPPPGDVYGQQHPMPYTHVQTPQYSPPPHPQHKPRRTHSNHGKSRHARSSSMSYASASTATLASRPMPPPLPQNYAQMPPMITPQPIRANTYPANAGYPQGMYSGGHPTQSMQWGRAPPAPTGFIPPMYPTPYLGKSEQPLLKRVFALFRGGKGSGSPTPPIDDRRTFGYRENNGFNSHRPQGHRSHRKRRDST